MVGKQSTHISIGEIPRGICLGTAVSVLLTIVLAAIGALLLDSEKIGEGSIGYFSVIILLLCSITGALVAVSVVKEKRLPVCLSVGCAYLVSLLSITALFYQGQYTGVGETILVIVSGVISVSFLGVKSNNKAKKRVRQ